MNHFASAGKMVDLGSGSVSEVLDYNLSRFACYLIAQGELWKFVLGVHGE